MLGRLRYAGLYLLSGLVGSAVVYWLSGEYTPTLGASGAIFGLMGALLVMAYKVRADMNQLLVWIGLNVAFTFFGRSSISWQGHLGGFVGGVVLAAVLAYRPASGVRRGRSRASGWSRDGRRRRCDADRRAHLRGCPQAGDEPGENYSAVILHR